MNKLLTTRELADFTGLAVHTLEEWRLKGRGPTYIRLGRHVRYDLAQVQAWIAASTIGTGV